MPNLTFENFSTKAAHRMLVKLTAGRNHKIIFSFPLITNFLFFDKATLEDQFSCNSLPCVIGSLVQKKPCSREGERERK